jgi:hypothetical protein
MNSAVVIRVCGVPPPHEWLRVRIS